VTGAGEETAGRKYERALALLRQQAHSSDDPEYASQLARLLKEVGQLAEARHWREVAAARYDELMLRHPEAFADHAADFWLTIGGDARKGRLLAEKNLETRKPPWLPRRRRLSAVLPNTCGLSSRWGRAFVYWPCVR
jgi:hypothetical protein